MAKTTPSRAECILEAYGCNGAQFSIVYTDIEARNVILDRMAKMLQGAISRPFLQITLLTLVTMQPELMVPVDAWRLKVAELGALLVLEGDAKDISK